MIMNITEEDRKRFNKIQHPMLQAVVLLSIVTGAKEKMTFTKALDKLEKTAAEVFIEELSRRES